MKPAAPIPEDNMVSLKAKSRYNFWTEQFSENPRVKNQEKPTF